MFFFQDNNAKMEIINIFALKMLLVVELQDHEIKMYYFCYLHFEFKMRYIKVLGNLKFDIKVFFSNFERVPIYVYKKVNKSIIS